MTSVRKLSGITLAMAAAALLATGSVATITTAHADGTVKCAGANSCKGTSACKTASNPGGPGANSCKGQGLSMTDSADTCKAAGGQVLS
jgi:hypothetical protein